MSETLEERIRCHAPGAASGYYLEFHPKNGEVVRYPKAGAFSLKPFCPPTGTPFGTHNLFFVRYPTDTKPLPPANADEPYPRVQIPSAKKSTIDRAITEFQTAPNEDKEEALEAETDNDEENSVEIAQSPSERMADLEVAIASTPAMITARADFEKQRMAMELAENNQDLLNKGQFSRDAAEALALNRAYRREVQVALEAQSNFSRRTAEEVQNHWAVLRIAQQTHAEGMRLMKEQLKEFARPTPPPPPIDYTPAIVEGLKSLRDFGVALVQARAGIPFAPPQPTSSTLPNQSAVAKLVAETPPASPEKEKGPAVSAQVAAVESTAPSTSVSALVPDADDDVLATCDELLGIESSQSLASPTVAPVSAVSAPASSAVSGVIDPASPEAKTEAGRLIKAFAETSEIEALCALMGPEQLRAYLQRLRQRAARIDEKNETPKK